MKEKTDKTIKFGFSHIMTPMPKFAKRLGAAFSAVAVFGLAQSYVTSMNELNTVFIVIGVIGAFLSSMFGEVKNDGE